MAELYTVRLYTRRWSLPYGGDLTNGGGPVYMEEPSTLWGFMYTHGNDIDTEVDIHTGGAYTLWIVHKVEHTHVEYTHGWSVHSTHQNGMPSFK